MELALLGLLASCCGLFVVLFVSALLLRAAVASASRIVKPTEIVGAFELGNWDDWDSDEPPRRQRCHRPKSSIPEPGIGKGMLVAFTATLFTSFVCLVMTAIADDYLGRIEGDDLTIIALFVVIPVGFCTLTLLLAGLLPTTLKRAALVAILYHVYGLVIAAVIVAIGWGCMAFWR